MGKKEVLEFSTGLLWIECFTMEHSFHLQLSYTIPSLCYLMCSLVMILFACLQPYSRDRAIRDNSKIFNYRLCRARRTSENAFGLLPQVFRIFYTPINILTETVDDVVIVSCCLHNMLRDAYITNTGTSYHEPDPTEDSPKDNLVSLARAHGYANFQGCEVRDSFAAYFNTDETR